MRAREVCVGMVGRRNRGYVVCSSRQWYAVPWYAPPKTHPGARDACIARNARSRRPRDDSRRRYAPARAADSYRLAMGSQFVLQLLACMLLLAVHHTDANAETEAEAGAGPLRGSSSLWCPLYHNITGHYVSQEAGLEPFMLSESEPLTHCAVPVTCCVILASGSKRSDPC